MVGFLITALLVIVYFIKNVWIKLFFIWVIILKCLIYSIFVITPVKAMLQMNIFSDIALTRMTAGMIILIGASYIRKDDHEYVFNIFCLFTIFQSILWCLQNLGLDIMQLAGKHFAFTVRALDFAGTLGNKDFLAACMAISIPMFFRKKWFWCLIGILPILIILKTTMAALAVICASIFWILKSNKDYGIFVIFGIYILSLLFFIFIDFGDGGERMIWWNKVFMGWKGWIWLGGGFGTYPLWSHIEHAHNDYLEAFYDGGIVCIFIIMGFVYTFIRKAIRVSNKRDIIIYASLVAVGINAIGNYPFHLAPSGFMAAILLGMYSHENTCNLSTC